MDDQTPEALGVDTLPAQQPNSSAPAEAQTPPQWSDIVSSSQFQRMDSDTKEAARQQFYSKVISPQVPPELKDAAKQQFDAKTAEDAQNFAQDPTLGKFGQAAVQTIKDFPQTLAAPYEKMGDIAMHPSHIVGKDLGETASNVLNMAMPLMGVPEEFGAGVKSTEQGATSGLLGIKSPSVGQGYKDFISDETGKSSANGWTPIPYKPKTADEGLEDTKTLYSMADDKGGVGGSQTVMNKWLDNVQKEIPKENPAVTNARGGAPSQTQTLIDNLEKNRNQMISYSGLDQMDKFLGNEAHQAFKSGDNLTGSNISKINDLLLQTMKEAPQGTLPGAEYGEAARQAFMQQLKLRKLEQMQAFAQNTKNPATSVQAQMRQLYNKESKSKTSPWTPQELDLANTAARTGDVTDLLQTTGTRLSWLASKGLLGKAASFAISKASRAGADAIQFGKLNDLSQHVSDQIPNPNDIKGVMKGAYDQ